MINYNCAQNLNTTKYSGINAVPVYNTRPVNFKSNTAETQPSEDVVEISTKPQKKKKSVVKKILAGIGITVGAIAVTIIAISKHQQVKPNKLYKEKLVPKIFDKKLVFKEATSREDALKYAKEILGVQKVDESMTLDVLNYANEGITNVVNKNIGKEVFIPRSYFMDTNTDEKFLAYVVQDIKSKRFGEMGINQKLFDNEWLTQALDKRYKLRNFAQNSSEIAESQAVKKAQPVGFNKKYLLDKNTYELWEKYKESAEKLTAKEKRILYYTNNYLGDLYKYIHEQNWTEVASELNKKHTIQIDINKLKDLSKIEQYNHIHDFLADKNISEHIQIVSHYDDGLTTIYHEMGHLQDFAKNLKELDLKFWKLPSFKESWQKAKEARKKGKKPEVSGVIDDVNNRWSGTTYGDMKKLFEEKPEKFKELYPDLYEHLTNKEIQETAGKVSWYAQTSIGEFIADTYKKMINGDTIPDNVLALYKKYNGPLPNGF